MPRTQASAIDNSQAFTALVQLTSMTSSSAASEIQARSMRFALPRASNQGAHSMPQARRDVYLGGPSLTLRVSVGSSLTLRVGVAKVTWRIPFAERLARRACAGFLPESAAAGRASGRSPEL